MKELQNEFLVAELYHGCDVGMPECTVRSVHQGPKFVLRELARGNIKRENGHGKIDKGVRFPVLLPVLWQRGYVLWDVQPAVRCKTGQDGLRRAAGMFRMQQTTGKRESIDLFEGEKVVSPAGREILHCSMVTSTGAVWIFIGIVKTGKPSASQAYVYKPSILGALQPCGNSFANYQPLSFDYSTKCHVPKKEGAKMLCFQLSITRLSLQLAFELRWEYYSFKST